ncbi:hypothetical protein PVAR5_0168 [Paecilomyces variotii No. 5]|uniref:Uncharacterized protein n=1 Tax=Byssochlamys spectabilis (strain No. 5 / NBRC 109023) TaxID=1356009 RepID=V5HQN2_BYSSN|nr:hypothetical protein PVAR5_0168 [Paecilomyces variotii No. 5]
MSSLPTAQMDLRIHPLVNLWREFLNLLDGVSYYFRTINESDFILNMKLTLNGAVMGDQNIIGTILLDGVLKMQPGGEISAEGKLGWVDALWGVLDSGTRSQVMKVNIKDDK